MAIYNIGGTATITDIISGIYQGSGNITTAKRIQGGSFGSALTFKSVPTNTSTSRHSGSYSGTSMEFTNSGLVEFADGATGMMTGIKGPPSTIEAPAFGSTSNIWEDSSTAGRFLLLRFGSVTVAGGTGSTPYSGTRQDNNNPYFTTSGRTWETRQNDDVFYERGANQSGDNYAIIKHTCKVVVVRVGGTTLTIATNTASNFTDNILRTEDPFTVVVSPPTNTLYKVKYGSTTTTVQTGTFTMDEGDVDRGETIKIGAVRLGFAMVYQEYTVPVIEEGGSRTVNINITTPEPYPSGIDSSGVTLNSYSWDSTNNWLIADFANIPQDNLVMNKIWTETMMSGSTTAGTTIDAILHFEDTGWYQSGGVVEGQFINPKRMKETSSTAKDSPLTKETRPFYDILGTSTDIYEFTDQDDELGQNTLRPGITVEEIVAALKPVIYPAY